MIVSDRSCVTQTQQLCVASNESRNNRRNARRWLLQNENLHNFCNCKHVWQAKLCTGLDSSAVVAKPGMVMDVLSDRLLLLVTYEGMDPKLPLCLKTFTQV